MDNPKKIVLIGCSGHYQSVLDAVGKNQSLRLSGFAKGAPDEDTGGFLKEYRSNLGFTYYEDYQTMLEREQPDIAVVNSFFDRNCEIAVRVLEQNIHCYCEKPAALDSTQLARLQKAAAHSTAQYASMLEMRYHPSVFTLRNQIRQGKIGEVLFAGAQKSYKLGIRPEFYHHRESYGGTLLWVGIHALDMIAWTTGLPLAPLAAYHASVCTRGNGDMETLGICSLKLGAQGLANITLDYFMPDGAPTHGDDRLRIVGSAGILEARQGKLWLTNEDGLQEQPLEAEQNIFEDFINRLIGRCSICPTADESLAACALALRLQDMADCLPDRG